MQKYRFCLLVILAGSFVEMCGVASAQDNDAATSTGVVTKHAFAESKVFPGTTRNYWLYVPAQYTGDAAACVFVSQDGIRYNAPVVFDRLIAEGAMPVTIGVFVSPGIVPANQEEALPRYNRSYEYDSMNGNYATFLLDELLPYVEKQHKVKLSDDGNDRAIAGNSSGGIAAFTAAWHRPDGFSRVFTGVGTYVGLRGGNEYATLIRKIEPKPLRVFLQDGSNDLNIYGGDWWMANQTMQRALEFAGYEVKHHWDKGGHNGKGATKVFPDAVRYLWKDYPEEPEAGLGSPKLQAILIPDQRWQTAAISQTRFEGIVANSKGEVFYNMRPDSQTHKLDSGNKHAAVIDNNQGGDGQRFGPDGRLYMVATKTEQILAYDESGKAEVIAENIRGNDLVVTHKGGIYVTQPDRMTGRSNVWYISPNKKKRIVDKGLRLANGITLSPDQSLLYVADSRSHWVYSYQIQADGSLKYKQKFYHLHVPDTADDSGADGMRVDSKGRLYVATRMGIQVCDQAGRVNCIIPTPNGRASNLCFGGPKFDVLYVTSGDRIFRRQVKAVGVRHGEAPSTPPKPRL